MLIKINDLTGDFAENKDVAKDIRINQIMPSLKLKEEITLDFTGVSGATQSFMHALISDGIRNYSDTFFDLVLFKGCSPVVKEVVNIVAEYMQETE
ncbi:STAS-like domain-containing protein [Candidatus Woesebacteria bacterium]|nr:STAS-like domain-containing protein [Candidatus Woesebacteria bacterium]